MKNLSETTLTPIAAFYQRVAQMPDNICFVQPVGDEVIEYSWARVNDEVRRMANYLYSLELPPQSNIALFSKNCVHWIIADLAIWMAGHVSVPLYPTLTAESIAAIMEHSECSAIFVGKVDGWEAMKPGVPANIPVIGFPSSPEAVLRDYPKWDTILETCPPFEASPDRDRDELATIVYTSGTTGMPKGVMHSFGTMGTAGILAGELYNTNADDRALSYLPLAHVAERAAMEICQLYQGFTIYFSHSLDTFAQDLQRASPTLFFAVPRIWMKMQQAVLGKVSPGLFKLLINTPLVSRWFANKLLKGIGLSDVKIALSGAAPLSLTIINWYRQLGLEILEGYGMTENFAYSHTSAIGHSKPGYVGTANPQVDCRFTDAGELLVRSPCNMLGYYKAPELTAEVLGADGFFATGDIGEIDEQGRLRITGRVKELFKTSKGKYVAPAPIENLLMSHSAIEQICVTGASLPSPVALVNLSERVVKQLADAEFRAELVAELTELREVTNKSLDKHERISCLVIVPEAWAVENNFTTPTLKIKRQQIDSYYGPRFEQWSAQQKPVIFADDC
jgi:long-subunit acyl-CoA synthetase (AMP-forming)